MENHEEIAVDILTEITVLNKTIKTLIKDQLMINDALTILSVTEALKFVLDTVPSIKRLVDELKEANHLLDEHLDYFFPMDSLYQSINK